MDASAVKALVARELEPLAKKLGVGHWQITASTSPKDSDGDGQILRGECNRLIDYDNAHITLNPEAFDDEGDALKTIRHELLHVVVSPFDLVWDMAKELMGDDAKAFKALAVAWTHATEKTIINLERMYQGLTASTAS